jgi:hypothetical protein
MIKQLHPTLKACKCGLIASRTELYKHFDATRFSDGQPVKGWFDMHGEVPLNMDDLRLAPKPILVTDSNFHLVFPTLGQPDERNPE